MLQIEKHINLLKRLFIKHESKDEFEFITFEGKKLRYGIDSLAGDNSLRAADMDINKIYEKWQQDSLRFKKLKQKYHLY